MTDQGLSMKLHGRVSPSLCICWGAIWQNTNRTFCVRIFVKSIHHFQKRAIIEFVEVNVCLGSPISGQFPLEDSLTKKGNNFLKTCKASFIFHELPVPVNKLSFIQNSANQFFFTQDLHADFRNTSKRTSQLCRFLAVTFVKTATTLTTFCCV